jgi:hypothetical protein
MHIEMDIKNDELIGNVSNNACDVNRGKCEGKHPELYARYFGLRLKVLKL